MSDITQTNEEFKKGYVAGFKGYECPFNASVHFRDGHETGSYEIIYWLIFGTFPQNEELISKYKLRTGTNAEHDNK